jgi:hypothetical protein
MGCDPATPVLPVVSGCGYVALWAPPPFVVELALTVGGLPDEPGLLPPRLPARLALLPASSLSLSLSFSACRLFVWLLIGCATDTLLMLSPDPMPDEVA